MEDLKKLVIPIALLVVAILGLSFCLPKLQPPPGPTPTPTLVPAQAIKVLGGQIFLANENVVKRLRNEYNFDVTFEATGSGAMVAANEQKLSGFDCVWPGSVITMQQFEDAHTNLKLKKAKIFSTPSNFFTRKEYFEEFKKAGLAYEKNGVFLKFGPIIRGLNANKKWRDIGVNIDGTIKIFSSDPLTSGGGLSLYELVGSYMAYGDDVDEAVVVSKLDPILPSLVNLWERSGFQSKESPEAFEDYVKRGRSVVLGWSSESLFLSYYNALDDAHKNVAQDDIIGMYPETTIMTDHTLACWTPKGQAFLDVVAKDPQLAEIGWKDNGMRTRGTDLSVRAGDSTIFWVAKDLRRIIEEPKPEAANKIKEAIAEFKKSSGQ